MLQFPCRCYTYVGSFWACCACWSWLANGRASSPHTDRAFEMTWTEKKPLSSMLEEGAFGKDETATCFLYLRRKLDYKWSGSAYVDELLILVTVNASFGHSLLLLLVHTSCNGGQVNLAKILPLQQTVQTVHGTKLSNLLKQFRKQAELEIF